MQRRSYSPPCEAAGQANNVQHDNDYTGQTDVQVTLPPAVKMNGDLTADATRKMSHFYSSESYL